MSANVRITCTFAALLLACATSSAEAALVFFTDEGAFNAAAPGLAVQTFSAATVVGGDAMFIDNPLNSSTNNGIFASGDILAGLSISATISTGGDLTVTGVNFAGLANKAVFANQGTLDLSFSPGVQAAGLGLLSSPASSDFTLSFYDASDLLLGTTTVLGIPNTGGGLFFGVVSSGEQIARINSSSNTVQNEGVDLVRFGAAAVPEPGSVILLFIGVAGLVALHRPRPQRDPRDRD
jgi:hypothetical protein